MHPRKGSKWETEGCHEIHSIMETLSNIYNALRRNADQETVQGDDDLKEEISEVQIEKTYMGLGRAKSAPTRSYPDPVKRIFKIQDAFVQLKCNLKQVKRLQVDLKTSLNEQLDKLLWVLNKATTNGTLDMRRIDKLLEEITKTSSDLMDKVSVLPERRRMKRASSDGEGGYGSNCGKSVVWFPSIHAEEDLERLAFFRQVKDKFEKLSTDHQICLLSFAVFPENLEVNGTLLMYWWIGEGVLPDTGAEATAEGILYYFMELNLIEPVVDRRKMKPSTYKMNPFVHSSVVLISKEIGLFDMYRKWEKPTMNKSDLKKVCLVEGSSSQPQAKAKNMPTADIETVFNVSEQFPDFIFKWFSSMKVLKVLYLGRWERTEREIEVDSHGLMKYLSSMSKLRFLSFQGITTIRSISSTAFKLPQLIILDLRGCYNLERLPNDIHNLQNLVYLDLTSCYALENIPMRVAWLLNLEVLKGFVVADEREIACKLIHLTNLSKLRKLSVRVDRKDFGLDELVESIKDFRELQKLKVLWGRVDPRSKKLEDDKYKRTFRTVTLNLPSKLKNLDLRRFPGSKLPVWLQPQNLLHLEKLQLGSSRRLREFSDSLPKRPSNCSIKVLRLKFLHKLKLDWIELKELYFPKLYFLEMYECPRVTLCPCDRDGIWKNDEPE